ncbi:MAG: hypothetical protein HY360_26825 [Verrucomicrobia bacterium]|nr:hypothetical protein [Verrucomicrobiota bacterium]
MPYSIPPRSWSAKAPSILSGVTKQHRGVVTVGKSQIEPLTTHELPHVRSLAEAPR